MSFAVQFLLIILLTQIEAKHTFFDSVIQRIEHLHHINTLVIVHDNRVENCTFRDWNPRGIPSLRINELGSVQLRGNFNHVALALVYMGQESDIELLDIVAKAFECNRQERIMLWSQTKVTKLFLDAVIRKASKFKFLQIIVLEIGETANELISSHRLLAFPTPRFERIYDFFKITFRSLFVPDHGHFQGVTTVVITNTALGFPFPTKLKSLVDLPKHRVEDKAFFEFAVKYNLSLKFLEENASGTEHFDIQLGTRFIGKRTLAAQLGYMSPRLSTSIIVVVPCGQERSIAEIFKHVGVQTWLFYIFCVYALLILVETFIIVVTHRITGRTYCPTRINPFVNLRIFGAILGMSFPVSRRQTLSLRQLSLAMSIFGMVFSNFFSCKLSALLTKHSYYPQVTNFEELRASGLTVIVDPMVRPFIESELDSQFFQRVIPRAKFMPLDERFRLLLSLNDSYGYIILEESFFVMNSMQQFIERRPFCTSKDLIVGHNLPRLFKVEDNSYYKWPLTRVVTWIQEAGISQQWLRETPEVIRRFYNISAPRTITQSAEPLTFKQLKWLWCLILLGYGIATLVFLVEIFLGRGKKGNRKSRRVENDSVA